MSGRIIWLPGLDRQDLANQPREALILAGRWSSAKPTRLRQRLPAAAWHGLRANPLAPDDLRLVASKQRIKEAWAEDPTEAAYALAACGAEVAATLLALELGGLWAAPVSGFHHASYDGAWGYCTYNGLVLAARIALQEDPGLKVLIIDGDTHYGDGCVNLLNHQCSDRERKAVRYVHAERPEAIADELFWAELWAQGAKVLVLYQAGVDGHVDDPLRAGSGLTDEAYAARDQVVYNECMRLGWPLVVNLAGGYTAHSLVLHQRTLEALHAVPRRAVQSWQDPDAPGRGPGDVPADPTDEGQEAATAGATD